MDDIQWEANQSILSCILSMLRPLESVLNPIHHLRQTHDRSAAQGPTMPKAVGKDPYTVLPTPCLDKILLDAMEKDRGAMKRLAGVSITYRSHVLNVATHLVCGAVAQGASALGRAVQGDIELPLRTQNFGKPSKSLLRQARQYMGGRQASGVVAEATLMVRQHRLRAAEELLKLFMHQWPELSLINHELGEIYCLQGRFEAALLSFKWATPSRLKGLAAEDVMCPKLARRLGHLAASEGDAQQVEAYYLRAIALNPNYYEAHLALSSHYAATEPQTARDQAQWCISIDPDRFQGHYQLACLFEQSSNFPAAKGSYSQCLAINAEVQAALFGQGRMALRLGDFAEASRFLGQASEQGGGNEAILHYLSRAQRALNLYDQAEITCHRALKQNNQDAGAHWELGCIAHDRGNYDAAAARYQEAQALGVADGDFYCDLAFNHLAQGRHQDAEVYFRRATKSGLRSSKVYRGLGHALFNQQMFEQAKIAYKLALRQGAETIDVWEHLGDVYYKLDRIVEAVATLQEAIDKKIDRPLTHLFMGAALLANQHRTQAMGHFQYAVEQGCEDIYAYSSLGQLNLRMGRFTEAQQYLQCALNIDESQPELWNELGFSRLALKHRAEADICFMRAEIIASRLSEERQKMYLKHRAEVQRNFSSIFLEPQPK